MGFVANPRGGSGGGDGREPKKAQVKKVTISAINCCQDRLRCQCARSTETPSTVDRDAWTSARRCCGHPLAQATAAAVRGDESSPRMPMQRYEPVWGDAGFQCRACSATHRGADDAAVHQRPWPV